jgi:hypothetical protein
LATKVEMHNTISERLLGHVWWHDNKFNRLFESGSDEAHGMQRGYNPELPIIDGDDVHYSSDLELAMLLIYELRRRGWNWNIGQTTNSGDHYVITIYYSKNVTITKTNKSIAAGIVEAVYYIVTTCEDYL